MSFACDEAQENRDIYFPMKDTGPWPKNWQIDNYFVDFLGLFVTLA